MLHFYKLFAYFFLIGGFCLTAIGICLTTIGALIQVFVLIAFFIIGLIYGFMFFKSAYKGHLVYWIDSLIYFVTGVVGLLSGIFSSLELPLLALFMALAGLPAIITLPLNRERLRHPGPKNLF